MAKHKAPNGPPGTRVRVSRNHGPQIIASGGKCWTDEAERLFLDHLATSCNVRESAVAAGFSAVTVYAKRRADPGFAERWQAALEQGYLRIEMLLVQRAGQVLDEGIPDPTAPLAEMTVKDAITVLQLHRAAVKGTGRLGGRRARPRSLAEVTDSILTKLEAIEVARRAEEGTASVPPGAPGAPGV